MKTIISPDHSGYNISTNSFDFNVSKQKLRNIFEKINDINIGHSRLGGVYCNVKQKKERESIEYALVIEDSVDINRHLADKISIRKLKSGVKETFVGCEYSCGFSQELDEYVDMFFTVRKKPGNKYNIKGNWADSKENDCDALLDKLNWKYKTEY